MRAAATTSRSRVGTPMLLAALLPASLLTVATQATPAHAAFPGVRGLIAFVSDRDTAAGAPFNDEIYVIDEHGAQRRLTNDAAADTFPAMLPNGKEIAFVSQRNDGTYPNPEGDFEIYVMDANDDDRDGDGDNLRRITNDATAQSNLAWSPDGRKILFTCGADVCLMDADGSEVANLTAKWPGFDGQAVFSPDGATIAFLSNRDGKNDVYLMNANGSGQTQITSSPASASQPEFSPDGTTPRRSTNS